MEPPENVHPFVRAARSGDIEEVSRMIDEDPELCNMRTNPLQRTPMIIAAGSGHANIVRLLIDKGAAVDAADSRGATSLQISAWWGHEEVVNVLLERGASVGIRSRQGLSALMNASMGGHLRVIARLLKHTGRQDVNDRNLGGQTALWWACFYGHMYAARALLLGGADHTIADDRGVTPQQQARDNHHTMCVGLIDVSMCETCRHPPGRLTFDLEGLFKQRLPLRVLLCLARL